MFGQKRSLEAAHVESLLGASILSPVIMNPGANMLRGKLIGYLPM